MPSILTVVFTAVAILAMPSSAAVAKPEVTLCLLSHYGIYFNTLHAYHAATYFEPLYPNVKFKKRIIAIPRYTTPLAPALAQGLVASEGSHGRCHMLIGPGWSSLCMALGLIVNSLWVESISTTTLITADNAPHFSRILPSDGESTKGTLTLFSAFGWAKGNTICTDNGYGRSQLDGFAKGNVSVLVARCLAEGAEAHEYDKYLEAAVASESRIVFVAMDTTNSVQLANRALIGGYHKRLVFVFSEASCAGTRQAYRLLPGSLCATYRRDDSIFNAFLESFRNNATYWPLRTELQAGLGAYVKEDPADAGSSTYSAYAVDAVRFMMNAANQWYADKGFNGSIPVPLAKDFVAYARRQTFNGGITGKTVALDPKTGARIGSEFDFRQSTDFPDGDATAEVRFPNSPVINMQYYTSRVIAGSAFDGSVDRFPPFNWLAGENTSDIIGYSVPPPATPADKTLIYAGVVVAGILLIVVAVAAVFVTRHFTRHRRCPTDASDFTAFFVSVRNEAALRDADCGAAELALQIVEKAARSAARNSDCHHATRLDAHHLFVAVDTNRALQCIAALQQNLAAVKWPKPAVKIVAAAPGLQGDATASRQRTVDGSSRPGDASARSGMQSYHSGPRASGPLKARVCVGLWTGSGKITFDAERDTYMYSGTTVDCAAAMCDAAGNGEALIPAAFVKAATWFGSAAADGTVDLPSGSGHGKTSAEVAVFVAHGADDLESLASSAGGDNGSVKKGKRAHGSNASSDDGSVRTPGRGGGQRRVGAFGGGGLAAALQSSDGGLAARRAGLVAALIPELRRGTNGASTAWSTADLTRAMRTASDAVATACASCKAHIVGFDDGVFLCAVNVSEASMTAAPSTRAAQLAARIVQAMGNAPETDVASPSATEAAPVLHAHCGIAVGATAVGPLDPSKSLPKRFDGASSPLASVLAQGVSIQGGIAERARALAGFAADLGEGALTTCHHHDISHAIVSRAVDIVAWPDSVHAVTPDPHPVRPLPLSSVLAEVSDVAEGEWLYQLDGINRNPNAAANAAVAALLRGDVDRAAAELKAHQCGDQGGEAAPAIAAQVTADRIMCIVDDARRCARNAPSDPSPVEVAGMAAGLAGVRLYAMRRTNALSMVFPNIEGTS